MNLTTITNVPSSNWKRLTTHSVSAAAGVALAISAVVAFGPKLELVIVTGKLERRSHLLIGQGPTAVEIIQVLGAILEENADRFFLGLAQERWIDVSAANVGETAHVT